LSDIFIEIHNALTTAPASFIFSPEATQILTSLKADLIKEINEAIQHGSVPPKSKKDDVLQHVTASLHAFNHVTEATDQGQKPSAPLREISMDTLHKEKLFVEYTDTQMENVMELSIFLFMC